MESPNLICQDLTANPCQRALIILQTAPGLHHFSPERYSHVLRRRCLRISASLYLFASLHRATQLLTRPGLSCPEIQRHASFRQAPTSTSHYSPIGALPPFESRHQLPSPSSLCSWTITRLLSGYYSFHYEWCAAAESPAAWGGIHPLLAFQAPSSHARSALVLSTRAPQPFDSLSVLLLDTASFPTRARPESILFALFCMVRELQRLTHGFQPSRRSTLRLRQHILEAR